VSERESDEVATHGEVLRWSSVSDIEERQDTTNQTILDSDITSSAPEICKLPVREVVIETMTSDIVRNHVVQARPHTVKKPIQS
jgi:hypothetical protein